MLVRSTIVLSMLALCFAVGEKAEPPAEIPLTEIWALDIPGTKDIRDLENRALFKGMKAADLIKKSVVENTKSLLSTRYRPPRGQSAGPAFIVTGIDLDALKEANAILAKKKERAEILPSNCAFAI